MVNNYSTTFKNKFSDHHKLTVELNFTYIKMKKNNKLVNPMSTNIYEYDLKSATKSDWKRFDIVLKEISKNLEEVTKEATTEEKLIKMYEQAERATSIVFQKKKKTFLRKK